MAFEKEFENLFRSFAELRDQQAKMSAEADKRSAETDKQIDKLSKELGNTDKQIDKLSKELGNIAHNNGDVAEEFFWNALKDTKEFEGIKIEYSDRNIFRKRGSLNSEFDILLWNGNSVIIVETKYKVHPNLIEKIKEQKIPNFKKLFSDKADHKIYYAIAGLAFPDEVVEMAKNEGFFVLRQAGENIVIERNEIKAF